MQADFIIKEGRAWQQRRRTEGRIDSRDSLLDETEALFLSDEGNGQAGSPDQPEWAMCCSIGRRWHCGVAVASCGSDVVNVA
jgi:hypothetical protein